MQVFPPRVRPSRRSFLSLPRLWKKPTPRTVLVIGGAGYIGSGLLPKLLARGHRVRLLDRLFYGFEPIRDVINHPNLEIMQADFRRVDKLVQCMQGVDAVIHLGAIVGDPACALDRDLTIEVNLMATRTIAEVAKGYGIRRFIFASTCSVYGASVGEELLTEESPLHPVSLYAVTKLASEKVLMDLASDSFSPTCLRFSTIYGLSGRTRFDLVVNLLTAKAVMDGEITIQGGDQWRPFLHVDDAALSLLHTLESPLPKVHKQVFNVGSDEQNATIQQIGEMIQRLVPDAELINQGLGGDRRDYRAHFGKIRKQLGFVPRWTLIEGVNQVLDVIRSGEVKDYRSAKYSNVKFLTEEENTDGLVRHESTWAYDLCDQVQRPAVSVSPAVQSVMSPFPSAAFVAA
jgi:nucleoside-diphosphate-sugar epimerase